MGIIIKPKGERVITIQGTDIELPSVYGRFDFVGRKDGETMDIATEIYISKEMFKTNEQMLMTNVPQGNFQVCIKSDESQSLKTAQTYVANFYTDLGYEVENEEENINPQIEE